MTPAWHCPRPTSPETRTETYLLLTWLWDFSSVTSLSSGLKPPTVPSPCFQSSSSLPPPVLGCCCCFRFLPAEHSSRASPIEAMFNKFLFFVQHVWRTLFPSGIAYCFGRECKVFSGDEKESWEGGVF